MARPVDPHESLPALDERVLARWRERDVARESQRRRAGGPARLIWERPAGAGEQADLGDLPAGVLADVFARYATMRGWEVERRGVRDCHAPAVELAAERELGLVSKADIERDDIGELNARCRQSAVAAATRRGELRERVGVASCAAATTLDPRYIESVWWAVKEIADQGLLYESVEVVAYCPRCETALTAAEVTHDTVVDRGAYVRLRVARDGGPLQAGDELLICTDAPWMLVANAAVAVDPELTYVRAKTGALDPPVVVAEALAERVLGDLSGVRILERFRGAAIDGVAYEPPFAYLPPAAFGARGHTVLLGFVTARESTGLQSIATAFGGDDRRLGARFGLAIVNPVATDGTFDERAGRYAGVRVADAVDGVIADLRSRGRLLREETREHDAAHCGHCATRLLSYAKASWYVASAQLRLAGEHAAHDGASGADRLLSRGGWWGVPLPVWRCADGHVTIVGSFDELEQRSGARLADPHRPAVDEVAVRCECGKPAARVPDLVHPWFEAGAMPFASRHEPFAGALSLDELYPADLACDDQPLQWLVSMLIVSALLRGGEQVVDRVVRAPQSDASPQLAEHEGADALRWRVLTGEPAELLRGLWSAYALAAGHRPGAPGAQPAELDRWIASRLNATIEAAGERLDDYDATGAARAIAAFAGELCGWYVRSSQARLRAGDAAARRTLRECLVTLAQLLAPFVPFVADEIYERLDGREPSVHLSDWPVAGARDVALETAIELARGA